MLDQLEDMTAAHGFPSVIDSLARLVKDVGNKSIDPLVEEQFLEAADALEEVAFNLS